MTEKLCGVYAIVTPGRLYIGSSVDVRDRWRRHRNALARGVHENSMLQRAYRKYGALLIYTLLEECGPEELLVREQSHMDAFDMGRELYNLAPHAGGGMRGRTHAPETRRKIASAVRGHKHTEATLAKLSQARAGKPRSHAERERMSASIRPGASSYKGVTKDRTKWRARVSHLHQRRDVGIYTTPALAYAMRLVYLAALPDGGLN